MTDAILNDWKHKRYKPVYWLDGDEDFYIDEIVDYAEHKILSEEEAQFNLTVFYGRDASWIDIINSCRRYPVFADKQVILIKEAQHMREIEKLEGYIEKPLLSTILVVAYKDKKVDGRSRFAKVIKEKTNLFTAKKMRDGQLPEWTSELIQSKGYGISQKALLLIVDHVGNDLNRISNEVDKLLVNLHDRKSITEDDVEKYIGISKEYNVFELQDAFGKRDLPKAIRIIQYFESNPKAAPLQLVLPALYNFFSKLFMLQGVPQGDDKSMASAIGVSPFFVKDYTEAVRRYQYEGIERALLLLHQYNLRAVGINDAGSSDASLLKEMAVKMIV